MPKPGTNKLSFSELNLDEIIAHPEIAQDFLRAMAYMMGYDDGNNMWRFLQLDSNGRLEVSSATGAGSTGNNSAVTATTTSGIALADNPDRKGFIIENGSANNVYVAFGNTAITSTGLLLGPSALLEIDWYTGPVAVITASGTAALRVIEVT